MNMKKSRFMYYGASELPEGMKEAIKDRMYWMGFEPTYSPL
jgi:hypothetical protein